MARPSNTKRDEEILEKRKSGWKFKDLSKFYNMSLSSLHEAIGRAGKRSFRLSTGKGRKPLA